VTSPARLVQLSDELLHLATRTPAQERLALLLLARQTLSLAERRGAPPSTLRSQREWLRALAQERPGWRAAA